MIEEALTEELCELESMQKQPQARTIDFDEEEETLDELEKMIQGGNLTPQERSMIEEALQEELRDLEAAEAQAQPQARTIDTEEQALDELEQLILKGDLTPQERSMIEQALTEELRELESMEKPQRPQARTIDFDEEE